MSPNHVLADIDESSTTRYIAFDRSSMKLSLLMSLYLYHSTFKNLVNSNTNSSIQVEIHACHSFCANLM